MKAVVLILMVTLAAAGAWYYRTTSHSDVSATSANDENRRQSTGARQPILVIVARAEYREIIDSIESIGTTNANESVTITSKVTDTVNLVHFDDGDYVEAGKILIEMTNREESALLAEAQANLDEARRQLSRQQDLGSKGLTPQSTIDEALSRVEGAEARFNATTARMNERLIRAPFSGVLGFREISPGTLLTPNIPITTLDDISVIKLDFTIPELYMAAVNPGFKILAQSGIWENQVFEGIVNSIGSRIDPVTRAVTIRALIENKERLLKPGMLLSVKVITDIRQALVIPESAFIQNGNETYIYLAGEDGLAHRRMIKIGARRIGYVEVIDGLNPGDSIIIEGGFKLQDKSPYRIESGSKIDAHLSGQNHIPSRIKNHVVI